MSAYLIAMIQVHDADVFQDYVARTPNIVARHGGKYLTRGAVVSSLEGPHFDERLVIIEFPDSSHARNLFNDPDYQEAAKFRRAAATSRVLIQDGVADTRNPHPNL